LFADRAFRRVEGEEVLVLAKQLLHLNIRLECNELRLLLDPTLDDFPVFRQSVRTLQGTAISADKALPYSSGRCSHRVPAGRPYSLRYGAGKALDSSVMPFGT
jgi:hypothetical protein